MTAVDQTGHPNGLSYLLLWMLAESLMDVFNPCMGEGKMDEGWSYFSHALRTTGILHGKAEATQ